eukprot:RCo023968
MAFRLFLWKGAFAQLKVRSTRCFSSGSPSGDSKKAKGSVAKSEEQKTTDEDFVGMLAGYEDEGFGEGYLPNEWEDGDFEDWTKKQEKKGAIPGKQNPKSKDLSEAFKSWRGQNYDSLVQREAAALAKQTIMNSAQGSTAGIDPTLRSLMEKLEAGQKDFCSDERELLDRLKQLSLGSERRLHSA